jgi:hypothetical protein
MNTGFCFFKFQDFFGAKDRFFERNLCIIAQVRSSARPPSPAASATATAEKLFEDTAKTRKDVFRTPESSEASILQPIMPIAIV